MMDRDGCIIPLDGLHGLNYTALLRRDTAFDGKFFVCVKTTRVYCRSICVGPDFLGHRIGLIEVSKEDRNMADNFEKKVAVDGPVVNAGELGSSTFSPGQALPAGPLGLGQRWTVARKREVVLRLLRDEPVQLLSRQLGVEIFRLEQWREKAIGGIDASLKQRKGDPVQAELDSAMKRIGELTMQVELLEAKTETFGPLGRRRSRR